MPRLPLHPASGTGINSVWKKSIRFVRYGCANRPFFHIVVMNTKQGQHNPPIEQLGSYDPMANKYNEKLVSLNFERIEYWLGQNVEVSRPIAAILGIAGFFPIHPTSYMTAWRKRKRDEEAEAAEANKTSEAETEGKAEIAG
ncbi:putative 28S ribosomal protein S16, mitochondrial [Habropoda laboriosa]|uniref:Small ribosomal subunit protein bS16m n=1 Tax=Habropoda laboriosa TaxID=597456 RepID=A0A0L7R8Q9_9HYME|nr:PREDICTED: probable 28S ribosomal protein S16, mitochondrial [Habropoda laboriosa]KOC67267.1 putative 28S ribosomal protein S16, mitochondrial [Habropoda laboriosa]